jgi:hypothetical protein
VEGRRDVRRRSPNSFRRVGLGAGRENDAGGASDWERGETMRERRDVDKSDTLKVNRMVEKKGDGLTGNNRIVFKKKKEK